MREPPDGGGGRTGLRTRIVVSALAVVMGALAVTPGASARPKPPPPVIDDVAPPPAWIETQRGDFWLAYSSFCWTAEGKALCADYVSPSRRTDVPRIVLRHGKIVRIHLGFIPTSAVLSIGGHSTAKPASRILAFRAARNGILSVFLGTRKGDASYVAHLAVR